eukprot:10138982-Karenia_brevis.AAC.1
MFITLHWGLSLLPLQSTPIVAKPSFSSSWANRPEPQKTSKAYGAGGNVADAFCGGWTAWT